MLYVVMTQDVENSLPLRQSCLAEHLSHLELLRAEGRLVLAGPFPAIDSDEPGDAGFSGSLIIAEFDSLAAAQSWADNDPYVKAGVIANAVVKPFKQVLP